MLCALVVSDTVVVKDHGAIILTDMPCRLTDIAYEESESSMLEEDLYEGITTIADRMELLSTVKRQVPIADHMVLESTVKRVYEAVEKEREAAEYQQLQEFLCTKRDKVVEEWRAKELIKKRSVCSVLAPRQPHLDSAGISPSSTGSARKRPKFSVRYHRTKSVVASVCSIPISASPLPTHATYVPVRRSHWADDSKELAFVPGLGDDAGDIGELLSMHDTTHRENLIAYGAECQQEQMNDKIDKVLRRVLVEMTAASSGDRGAPISPSAQDVVDKVANIMGESIERIQSRYENLSTKQGNRETEGTETWISSGDNLDDRFRKVVDSCRELWCRRCHIYDCDLHGSREKPSFAAQLVHGLRAERTRCREIPVFSDSTETCDDDKFSHIAELSAFHKSICKQMYSIFEGDVAKMSCVMRAPVRLIQGYIDSQKITGLPASAISCPISKSDLPYHSVKNYRNTWYNRYRDAEIYPFFYPCYHDEKCTDDNCTCIQNRFFCTKACGWGNASPNFFRGCDCKGRCIQTNCTCFGAKRECDPNLCKCTGCTDPPGQSAVKQRCRNDNIVMQRERPLLLGRSEISGWGLFTKRSLKPGDFVGEYTGEAISQEEAERRGQIADAKDCSYLFMVASDLVLDASRKGNKTRFMNHSETPNVEPRSESF